MNSGPRPRNLVTDQSELGKSSLISARDHRIPVSGERSSSIRYPRSASANSLPRLGLCLSFLDCFLFSTRVTGLGVPSTARDAAFTALVALNFLSFFFFGTIAI